MKILYANVIEQHAGWGAEWFVNRGLESLGHQTHCIDYRQHRLRLSERFADAPPADAFLLQRGEGFPLPILRSLTIPRFFWASELFDRCRDQDRLFRCGLFAHVFVRTPRCKAAVTEHGWLSPDQVSILLSAFDPMIHKPDPAVTPDVDALFVGTMTPRRRGWLDTIQRRVRVTVVEAFGEEMVRWMNRAAVVLNIHAGDYADTETRVFEALGSGAFLLTERLSAENPFTDEHLAQCDNAQEMAGLLERFLRDVESRRRIAAAGHRAAVAGHTYRHRAARIAQVMSREVSSQTPAAPVRIDPRFRAYAARERLRRMVAPVQDVAQALLARVVRR